MLITPHAVLGAALATKIDNLFLLFPISFSSHFVLDAIPHWQETLYPYTLTRKSYIRIILDLFMSFVLVFVIALSDPNKFSIVFLSAFIANIADFDSIAYIWKKVLDFKIFSYFYDFHCKIQKETNSFFGIMTQILIVLVSLIFVFK